MLISVSSDGCDPAESCEHPGEGGGVGGVWISSAGGGDSERSTIWQMLSVKEIHTLHFFLNIGYNANVSHT